MTPMKFLTRYTGEHRLKTMLLFFFVWLFPLLTAAAQPLIDLNLDSGDVYQPLAPHQAFKARLIHNGPTPQIEWTIAAGHYLYRDRMEIHHLDKSTSGENSWAEVSAQFLAGEEVEDELFGTQTVFRNETTVGLPQIADRNPVYRVRYQGCREGRFCYPPMTVTLSDPQ